MALSYKNADNEYFVHTDGDFFNRKRLPNLEQELAELKKRVLQLNVHVYFLERNVGFIVKQQITLSKRNAINNLRDKKSDDHEMSVQNFRNQVSQNKFDQEDIDIVNALGAAISAGGVQKP